MNISATQSHTFDTLTNFETGDYKYHMYRMTDLKSGKTFYRLGLDEAPDMGACDVEEIPHDIACEIVAKLFGIYVYHAETHEDMTK